MHVHKHTLDFEDENTVSLNSLKLKEKWDIKKLHEESAYDMHQSNKKNAHRFCSVKR